MASTRDAVEADVHLDGDATLVHSASLYRTARSRMRGSVVVPQPARRPEPQPV
jgi:2-methylaconitate cis-trans-isomerase PrpF